MAGAQSLVAVGGLGLIGANFWESSQRTNLDGLVWDGKPSPAAKSSLMQLGGEALLVVILYILAGQSDTMGTAMVVLVVTLWVLFFMTYYSKQAKKG